MTGAAGVATAINRLRGNDGERTERPGSSGGHRRGGQERAKRSRQERERDEPTLDTRKRARRDEWTDDDEEEEEGDETSVVKPSDLSDLSEVGKMDMDTDE